MERARLDALRASLSAEIAEEEAGQGAELSSIDQHPAEMATEMSDRERTLSLLEQVEGEVAALEDAYGRLEAGTYGTCEVCARPIGEERLDALPAARRCSKHQAAAEASEGPLT